MQLIKIEDIIIKPERQRKFFDNEHIASLTESILSSGLLHPIVLETDGKTLVAGECRMKAFELGYNIYEAHFTHNGESIPGGHIPYTKLEDLSDDQVYEAQLDENLRRKNISIQEEADAVARLHRMRQSQDPKHNAYDTAEELRKRGSSLSTNVKDMVRIADNLHVPEVANAKTRKEAIKAIEKKARAEFTTKLAESFDKSKSRHILRNDDCLTVLREMPDKVIDVTVSDPPYGIDAEDFGSQSQQRHEYEDSYENWCKLMPKFLTQLYRVSKDQAHAYLFCDFTRFFDLQAHALIAGWKPWPKPLIWVKSNGMLPRPDHGPRYTYECILFLNKGDKKVNHVAPDTLTHSSVQNLRHGAEKPAALFADLLSRSALPGDHVADFFAGSGPILPAANMMKCVATAVEMSAQHFGVMTERVEETIDG